MELLSQFIKRKCLEIKEELDISIKVDNIFLSHLNSIIDIWDYIKENVPNVKEPYIYYEGDSYFTLEWENINIYIAPNKHFDYTYKSSSGAIDVYNCKIPCSELLFVFKQLILLEQRNRSIFQKIKDWLNK